MIDRSSRRRKQSRETGVVEEEYLKHTISSKGDETRGPTVSTP